MADLYEYGVAVHLYEPIIKRAVVDFAVSADWTPAAGDVKISKDGGAFANVTNLPTAITAGNTAVWDYSITATEMQAKKIRITVSDAATKAVEDTMFKLDTYGNASAQHAVNLNDAIRAGLTALPNAAAEAAGGLYTRGSGAGQITQSTNGQVDVDAKKWNGLATVALPLVPATAGRTLVVDAAGLADANVVKLGPTGAGTAQTARDIGASVLLSAGVGTGQLDFTAGVVKANLAQILGTALTETAGQLAGGFKKFFNIGAPASTMDALTLVATATNLTNAPTAGDLTAVMKASVTTACTASTPVAASVTGAVGSVTGNVGGNVTGSVGSVLGNLGGNVIGSVASVVGNVGGNVVGTVASVVGSIGSIVNAGIDLIFDRAAGVETNYTLRQALRLILSSTVGKLSGAATATVRIRDLNDTKDRITATVDANGNRTAITTDVS